MSEKAYEGWSNLSPNHYVKTINDMRFTIKYTSGNENIYFTVGAGWVLSIGPYRLAKRDTITEARLLAHATARLWAGETE